MESGAKTLTESTVRQLLANLKIAKDGQDRLKEKWKPTNRAPRRVSGVSSSNCRGSCCNTPMR